MLNRRATTPRSQRDTAFGTLNQPNLLFVRSSRSAGGERSRRERKRGARCRARRDRPAVPTRFQRPRPETEAQRTEESELWRALTSWILTVAHIYVIGPLIHAACELTWAQETRVMQTVDWHHWARTILSGLGSAACGIMLVRANTRRVHSIATVAWRRPPCDSRCLYDESQTLNV